MDFSNRGQNWLGGVGLILEGKSLSDLKESQKIRTSKSSGPTITASMLVIATVLLSAMAAAGQSQNYVAKFNSSGTTVNSSIFDNGNVGIGTATPSHPLDVQGYSGTSQSNISVFLNGTNGAYTSLDAAGTSSVVRTWNNGAQILEFVPYSSGNGIVSAYTGNLLFQTNYRTTQMSILPNGNVGIGTTSPGANLEVNGNVKLTSGTGGSITFADGTTQSTAWTGTLCGGDYAESVEVAGDRKRYEPGDVLVLSQGLEGDVAKSTEPYSTLVTGIYSTKPGLIGKRSTDQEKLKNQIPMAMVGIVPVKVSAENGPIKRGDLLVTSSTEGYAMKGTDRNRMLGAVIGKAMGNLNSEKGVIEAVVSLQ